MTNQKKLISIVSPAYCEQQNIPLLYAKLKALFLEHPHYEYEIIFVNDGSTDWTRSVIQEIAKKDPHVRGVSLSRNFWHQSALMAWYKKARWDAVISMDSDLQHPVDIIKKFLQEWERWFDIVYAKAEKKQESFLKRETASLFYAFFSKISNVEMQDSVWDFRLIDKKVLHVFNELPEKDVYIRGMMGRLWFSYTVVTYDVPKRRYGESHYSLSKMFKLGTDWLIGFSLEPLKIGLYLWVIMILMSVFFFAYVTIDFFVNQVPYPLYKWLTIMMFGFMGLMFVFLWIIAEYIGRIYNQVRERPLYVIKDQINIDSEL